MVCPPGLLLERPFLAPILYFDAAVDTAVVVWLTRIKKLFRKLTIGRVVIGVIFRTQCVMFCIE